MSLIHATCFGQFEPQSSLRAIPLNSSAIVKIRENDTEGDKETGCGERTRWKVYREGQISWVREFFFGSWSNTTNKVIDLQSSPSRSKTNARLTCDVPATAQTVKVH